MAGGNDSVYNLIRQLLELILETIQNKIESKLPTYSHLIQCLRSDLFSWLLSRIFCKVLLLQICMDTNVYSFKWTDKER